MKTKFLPVLAALLAALWTSAGIAEEPATETVELTLHPAAETKPALRYHLLPTFLEQTPHNAAPMYDKAFLILQQNEAKANEAEDKIAGWLMETPLDELPLDDVRKTLEPFDGVLRDIEIAARRSKCEWDPPIREAGTELFSMLLPEIQAARRTANLLAMLARLQIAEGKLEEAVRTIRTAYAFSRHVGQQPFLISGLVALAMARVATNEFEHLIQSSRCPNLYWSLTNLPRPLVDLRNALELEYVAVYFFLPELREAQTGEHTAAEWDRLAGQLLGRLKELAPVADNGDQDADWKVMLDNGKVENLYAAAKGRLLARGRERAKIEAMPKSRVVLLDAAESFEEVRDELYKGFNLPYPEAAAQFDKAERDLRKAGDLGLGGQLAALLLPAIKAVNLASARGQRSIDALRCIEAIRMYAAAHGKLPEKLEYVKEAPIPTDVVTGEPFPYRVDNGVAILELKDPARTKLYRLRLAK